MSDYLRAIPLAIIRAHLTTSFFDPDEEEYVTSYLLGAAWETAQSFCNRRVYPDEAALPAEDQRRCTDVVAPMAFRQAVLLLLAHLYANREALADSRLVEMPLGAHRLLWPLRANLGV